MQAMIAMLTTPLEPKLLGMNNGEDAGDDNDDNNDVDDMCM